MNARGTPVVPFTLAFVGVALAMGFAAQLLLGGLTGMTAVTESQATWIPFALGIVVPVAALALVGLWVVYQ